MGRSKTILWWLASIAAFVAIVAFLSEMSQPSLAKALPGRDDRARQGSTGTYQPFALVELFTSQGCSSCPPADQLLREVDREARKQGKRVFPLSFHVDYWNRLGWRDPFSDSSYSERQRSYARRVSGGRVYTPQIVVNGSYDVLGSDSSSLRHRVREMLQHSSRVRVDLRIERRESSTKACASLRGSEGASLRNSLGDLALNLVLVERNLKTTVTRGENAGRRLHHDNVVREIQALDAGTCTVFQHPKGLHKSNASIVAFAQSRDNLRVLGATRRDLR